MEFNLGFKGLSYSQHLQATCFINNRWTHVTVHSTQVEQPTNVYSQKEEAGKGEEKNKWKAHIVSSLSDKKYICKVKVFSDLDMKISILI